MKAPNEITVSFNAEHLRIAQQLVRSLRHSIEQATPEAFLKRLEDLRFENRWLNEQRTEALKAANVQIDALVAKLNRANTDLEVAGKALKEAEKELAQVKSDSATLDRHKEAIRHIALALGFNGNYSERIILDEIDAIVRSSAALASLWVELGPCSRCPCINTCRNSNLDTSDPEVCRQTIRAWARKADKK